MSAPEVPDVAVVRPDPARAIHGAEIFCEQCGVLTPHRILRLDPAPLGGRPGPIQGIAKCRHCRWTHRFRAEPERAVEVAEVLSDGPRSVASRRRLPAAAEVEVGRPLTDPKVRVRRIERKDGVAVRTARADQIATLWVTPDGPARVPVSIVEGRRTVATWLVVPPERPIEVGATIEIDERSYEVRGLRARGRTWRESGEVFPAGEVQRVYVGRTVSPPAGRSAWSRERPTPRAFDSSTSRSGRSRSSPGVSRNRG